MAHKGITGRVVFADNNQGVPNLEVNVVDVYPIPDKDLGTATTDSTGVFELLYSPDKYQRWEAGRSPNIRVRIFGPVGRQLFDLTIERVTVDIVDLATLDPSTNPIRIHRNNVGQDPADEQAWLVTNATLDLLKGDPVNLSQGNTFEPLIDGTTLFPRVTKVASDAQSSIHFMNLNFRIGATLDDMKKEDFLITKFEDSFNAFSPPLGQPVKGQKIQEIMKEKANGTTGTNRIPVRVIVADIALKTDDAIEQVKEFFASSRVQTRVADYGIEVLHGRTVVVDGDKAFVLGSSFDQSYFSSPHLIRDARHRGSLLHDVGAFITGPAVAPIDETFVTVWNKAGSSQQQVEPVPRFSDTGEVAMQVLRTMPGNNLFPLPFPGAQPIQHGETSVLEAYQRAIAKAEEFIYIEDQYLTNSAIVRALIMRMKDKPDLQLILVLNINPEDFPGYTRKQIRNIKQIQKEIQNPENRFRVFTLWTTQVSMEPDRAKKPFEIMNIAVHSKVAIIDDKWATIGTANLDGSGLNAIEISDITKAALSALPFVLLDITLVVLAALIAGVAGALIALIMGALAVVIAGVVLFTVDDITELPDLIAEAIRTIQSSTQHVNPLQTKQPARHVELNIVLYNGVAGLPQTEEIKKFREKLWSEHLGLSETGPFPAKPQQGWVKLWEETAERKKENILAFAKSVPGTTGPEKANVLEWRAKTDAKYYLKALGINIDDPEVRLTIRKKADTFNFLKGEWEKNKF